MATLAETSTKENKQEQSNLCRNIYNRTGEKLIQDSLSHSHYLHSIFMIKEKVPGTVVEIVVFVLVAVVEVVLGGETEKWTKL